MHSHIMLLVYPRDDMIQQVHGTGVYFHITAGGITLCIVGPALAHLSVALVHLEREAAVGHALLVLLHLQIGVRPVTTTTTTTTTKASSESSSQHIRVSG